MDFISTQKFLLTSPRKIRVVTDMVKDLTPARAVEVLPFVPKRAAVDVAKVIKAAIASAKAAGVGDTELKFKEIQVNEGPRLKRGHAASRGRWHPYKKRMSHIRVVLESVKKEVQKAEKGAQKKEETTEMKKAVKKSATKKSVKKGAK